uniref:Cysteine rich secreted protein n=1 Tax=Riptortus pedestris TaxID=329032 RepID=R4WQE7_RIPPE|nr:cysteine rich secreted protein [Riptortus pedestris]
MNTVKMNCILLLLAGLIAASSAITCTPELCRQICQNPPTPQSCANAGTEYRPFSSLCQCCATCVPYLGPFDFCDPSPDIFGPIPVIHKHCRPGKRCVNNRCI